MGEYRHVMETLLESAIRELSGSEHADREREMKGVENCGNFYRSVAQAAKSRNEDLNCVCLD